MGNRVAVLCTLLAAVAVVFGTGAAASGDDNSSRAAPEAGGAATSIPTNGLIGHWPLDGNALDTSGHGNDGTIVGATPTTGIKGGAYEFDGTAHIDLPNFLFSTPTYTVSIWFETTHVLSRDEFRSTFSQLDEPSGTGPFQLFVGGPTGPFANVGPAFQAWNAGSTVFNPFVPQINPRDGRWHMMTGTYKDGQQQLFVDGALMTCPPSRCQFPGPLPTTSAGAHIGGQTFGPYHHPWIGRLDEAAIYNRVLSNVEVLKLYQATNPPPKAT